MAERKISFSLDLTTDQAKRAIDEFNQQLQKAAQGASAPAAEWNKVGAAISDSFKKALQDVKQLQTQIQDEMRKGASGIMQPGSANSMSSKLVEGLKEMIKAEHETVKGAIKTAETELSKNREEYSKMVKDLETRKLDPDMARQMASKQDRIAQLESELKTKTQATQVLSSALQAQAPTAQDVLAQLQGGGAGKPPGPPGLPPPAPTPKTPDPFKFGGKAGALMQLIANGGDLTSLLSSGGMLSVLSAEGGRGGAMIGTVLMTADRLIKGMQNNPATAAAAERQFVTGGATEVTASLMARQVMQASPTGAFGRAMRAGKDITGFQGGLGFVDALDQLQFFARSGFDREAAGNYIREKLLQEQSPFTQMQERAFQGGIDRGQALQGVERMFGMDRTQRVAASLQGMGIPLERMGPGMAMMAEFMGRLPGAAPGVASVTDMNLINMQNRFGLSDSAMRQVFRASAANSGAGGMIQGLMGMAGLGTAGTDIATGRVMGAGAEYAAGFDAAAVPGAMGVFTRGFAGVAGQLPGLAPAEQARYSNQVTNQRLQELNNPESLANRTAMGSLARLGITDPVEARIIMSMGLDQSRTVDVISKMTGRNADDVRSTISEGQKSLTRLQGSRFGGGRLDKVMGENFTFNALRAGTARDLDAVRAQGGVNPADLVSGGATAEQIQAGRAKATGRQDTTVDLMQESNAQIAGALAKLTGVIEKGAMKVRIVEGAEKIMQQDAQTEARRAADAGKVPNVGEPRTNQAQRGSTRSR